MKLLENLLSSSADLAAMTCLHEFTTRLLSDAELQPLLEEALDGIIEVQNADFGCIQFYSSATRSLDIVAQRGFKMDFLEHFRDCHDVTGICVRALLRGERVIVEVIFNDPDFTPHRQTAEAAGFCAVQSTPVFGRSGRPLGTISTDFRYRHRPLDRELR
jgi:GAF domain-containing protein